MAERKKIEKGEWAETMSGRRIEWRNDMLTREEDR